MVGADGAQKGQGLLSSRGDPETRVREPAGQPEACSHRASHPESRAGAGQGRREPFSLRPAGERKLKSHLDRQRLAGGRLRATFQKHLELNKRHKVMVTAPPPRLSSGQTWVPPPPRPLVAQRWPTPPTFHPGPQSSGLHAWSPPHPPAGQELGSQISTPAPDGSLAPTRDLHLSGFPQRPSVASASTLITPSPTPEPREGLALAQYAARALTSSRCPATIPGQPCPPHAQPHPSRQGPP